MKINSTNSAKSLAKSNFDQGKIMKASHSNKWALRCSMMAVAAVATPSMAKAAETAGPSVGSSGNLVASAPANPGHTIQRQSIIFVSRPVVQALPIDSTSVRAIAAATYDKQPVLAASHVAPARSQVQNRPKKAAYVTPLPPLSAPVALPTTAPQAQLKTPVHAASADQLPAAVRTISSPIVQALDGEQSAVDEHGMIVYSDENTGWGTDSAHSIPSADPYDIRFRADTLVVTPVLNVGLVESERTAAAGETVSFMSYNNYPSFVKKGELRIFRASQSPDSEPLATVEVDQMGAARWDVPHNAASALYYVYRVYGAKGKFDETTPQELTIVDGEMASVLREKPVSRPNFGEVDEAARRTIELGGMMASVTGTANPNSDMVYVGGQSVPIDEDGRFVSQQIVSRRGKASKMDVVIKRDGTQDYRVSQSFAAPKNDWFVVGQGEVTLGHSYGSGPAAAVSGDSLAEGSYAIGRGAFYAKGILGDDVRVTAALDTGETRVKDLLSNLDRKDPSQLLRRLNKEQYYPTYGDDSTLVEDAPTQGRFYLRVAKDDSQFVVGNFTTAVNGAELAQLDRGLFGALADFNSQSITSFGERKVQVTAFASDPGTVPGREEFRGTGGSLYFLKRQDVSVGSERLRIEIRDRTTGVVLETKELHSQQDYDFDPFQGRITLLRPLSSIASTGNTVREGSSSGNVPVLVARYEFSPAVGDLDGYTIGGRASAWLGDSIRLGVTAQRDTVEEADQDLLGADAMLRVTAGTYLKAEIAQTDGPGFGQSNSVDGGLTFTDVANPGTAAVKARAYRAEAAVNLAELAGKSGEMGQASAYYEHYDEGFSSAGRLTPSETKRYGAAFKMPMGDVAEIMASYDELSSADSGSNKTGNVDLSAELGAVTAKVGLRYEDRTPGTLYNSVADGSRMDAALELAYAISRDVKAHAFGQMTVDRDASRQRNNRAGVGLDAQITKRLSLSGEVSDGDGGLGADVQLNHHLGDGSEAYIGYSLFADRTDTGLDSQNLFTRSNRGTLTLGARQRFSDSLSVYGENRVGIGGTAPSLTRSFGMRFEPTEHLSFNGSFERGQIDDEETGLFRRTAGSIGVGYVNEGVRVGSSVEVRKEIGLGRDQTVWLLRNDLSYAVHPDWTFLSRFNMAQAENEGTSIRAADFTEAMAGFAFRPVNNEKLNALIRIAYYEDLGPSGQITEGGTIESPKQKSTIVSIDANYDLTDKLTVGAKYGYRQGMVSLARDSDDFIKSDAHLFVLRADYNVVKNWDVMVEGRALAVRQAEDLRLGALGAVYRHLGNNVKIGVGYSVSDFSDDLTDQSYSSHGPFLNLLGKF